MRRRFLLLLLAVASAAFAQNTSSITGNLLTDASGLSLTSGEVCFTPVDAGHNPTNFQGGGGGQVLPIPTCRDVVNGALLPTYLGNSTGQLTLKSSAYTSPAGIQYKITVTNNADNSSWTLGYAYVSGSTWSLDAFMPNSVSTLPYFGPSFISGPLTASGAVTAPSFVGALHGNADTATSAAQLAVTPHGCSMGQYSPTLDVFGNESNCQPVMPVPMLPLSGGTMTGPIQLAADPSVAAQAANKHYVDSATSGVAQVAAAAAVQAAATTSLPLAGGALTGPLVLAADPAASNQAATKHYVDTAAAGGNSVPLSGGTMTGPLGLPADPTTANQAATKHYVDSATSGVAVTAANAAAAAAAATSVPLAGGSMSGSLTLSGDPTVSTQAATKNYVDTTSAAALASAIAQAASHYLPLSGGTVTGPISLAADPTASGQAATKHYVDSAVSGVVTAASANSLPLSGGTLTGPLLIAAGGVAAPNGSVAGGSAEFGSQSTAGTGYVDLHSDGSTTDYDVRILSTGGTAGLAGSGTASILAASLALPALTTVGGTLVGSGTVDSTARAAAAAAQSTANAALPSTGGNLTGTLGAPAVTIGTQTLAQGLAGTLALGSGIWQSPYQISKRPRVDITDTDFGTDGGYLTGFNPACTTDNTAAISAAVGYSVGLAATNHSAPNLYIPGGSCLNLSTGILLQGSNAGMNIEGDGSGQSIIHFTGTSGYALKLIGGNLTSAQYGRIHLRGFRLEGTGHLTGATLLEIQNAQNVDVDDVALMNTGGIGLNLVNTERSVFKSVQASSDARSINMVISSNEDYWFNTLVLSPGVDYGGYVYNGNVNAVNGVFPTSGATIYPNYNAAITAIGGQNVELFGGSCKGTIYQGCVKLWGSNQFTFSHWYNEAFGPGSQNPNFQVVGVSPLSVLTTALTTSSTTGAVNAALYQPFYVTDQASIASFGTGWPIDIQPSDYTYPGDATASVLGGGITKGSRERVTVAAFYGAAANGAGSVQISARGQGGTTAMAWPAGAVLALPQISNSDMVSREQHYNGNLGIPSGDTLGCSQNTLNTNWLHSTTVGAPVGTPAMACAEGFIGPTYDGIAALTPNRGFSPDGTIASGQLAEENDYDFVSADSAHQVGAGLQFVSLNGQIKLNKYDCGAEQTPVTNAVFPASGTPISVFHQYNDGVCKFNFGFYPNDNGTDSYAHVTLNNLVTGAIIDTVQKAYLETTTQYQPYGAKIGPNFFGEYSIRDVGGEVEEDWLGFPFTAEKTMSVGGSLNYDFTATQDNFNKPIYPLAGINDTINGYVPASTYTFPTGTALAHLSTPSGGGNYTLPSSPTIGQSVTLLFYGLANPVTITAPSGTLNIDAVSVGSPWTYAGGYTGPITFFWDSAGWHTKNAVPFLFPVTVAGGSAISGGSGYVAPTLSSSSDVDSGTVTFTVGSSPLGAKGTPLFSIAFSKTMPNPCKFVSLSAAADNSGGSNAANATLGVYAGNYSTTGWTGYINGSSLIAGSQYAFNYQCVISR